MNELKVINEQQILGKGFKVYGDIQNPLFLAKDVAEWIEHTNVSKMIEDAKLDEYDTCRHFIEITYSYANGSRTRKQESLFLTEDGLYEVLMQSRMPIAKEFKREVKRILKQMRLTGGAVVEDREEQFINNYFPSFSDEVKLLMVHDLRKQNQMQKQLLEEQKPYVELAKKRLDANGLISITDATKTFEVKRGKITKWAKQEGYLHKVNTEVNVKGEKYFKVYDARGYRCIGINEQGLILISDNLEDIKNI